MKTTIEVRGSHWGGMLNVQRIFNVILNTDNLGIRYRLRPRGLVTLREILDGVVVVGLVAGFVIGGVWVASLIG